MLRKNYNLELNALNDALVELGNAASESVQKGTRAFIKLDQELAHELFSDDLRINAMTAELEKMAYRLIVLQQPVAQDLRMIITVLYVSNDLERIADYAVTIARSTLRSEIEVSEELSDISLVITKMANLVQEMMNDAIDAYLTQDASKAKEIAKRDVQIDMYLEDVYRLTTSNMKKDSEVITNGINDITVATSLERIGDYVTNICERIVFVNTGEIVEL